MSTGMEGDAYARRFALPFGFTVTFRLADGTLECLWTPDVPHIRQARARRKLLAAYMAARAEFMRDIATVIGERALIVDFDGLAATVSVVEPEARH